MYSKFQKGYKLITNCLWFLETLLKEIKLAKKAMGQLDKQIIRFTGPEGPRSL